MTKIDVYAPTVEKPDNDIESFHEEVDNVLKSPTTHDLTIIIMGYFNAKVGDEKECTGYMVWELGTNGAIDPFCQNNNFIISNRLFKLTRPRLQT